MGFLERWDRRNQRHLESLPQGAGTDEDDETSAADVAAGYGELGVESLSHGLAGLVFGAAFGIIALVAGFAEKRRRRGR